MIFIFIAHFIGDFLLQTRWMATNKSNKMTALAAHILVYGGALYVGTLFTSMDNNLTYVLINMLLHAGVDGLIWNGYKYTVKLRGGDMSFKYYEDPHFYSTIGFDQLLHTLCLYVTAMYLV